MVGYIIYKYPKGIRITGYNPHGGRNEGYEVRIPSHIGGLPIIEISEQSFKKDTWSGNNIGILTIPNTVKWIGAEAFGGQRSLRTISLPASIERIGWRAFYNNVSLKEVRMDKVPNIIDSTSFYKYVVYTR